jgi:hypothetical protein
MDFRLLTKKLNEREQLLCAELSHLYDFLKEKNLMEEGLQYCIKR